MRKTPILVAACSVGVLAGAAVLQQSSFGVQVEPSIISRSGDTVVVAYRVTVAMGARDSLASFAVDAPGGVVRLLSPPPDSEWMTVIGMRKRSIGKWIDLDRLFGAGQSTPPLTLVGTGMLAVVPYWAARPGLVDSVIAETASDSSPVYDTLMVVNGVTGKTIGVVPPPADRSSGALATRLLNLIGEVCDLGWVDENGVCNSLKVKARPERGPLEAMLNELDAQRGRHVNAAAYALLTDNARYLLSRL